MGQNQFRIPFGVDLMVMVPHDDEPNIRSMANTKCTTGGDPTQKVETDD